MWHLYSLWMISAESIAIYFTVTNNIDCVMMSNSIGFNS